MRILCSLVVVVFALVASNAMASDLGSVSGAWEPNGHWQDAGPIGVVCEYRPAAKKTFKVKVYQANGHLYEEYTNYRFWPNSCDVTTEELQANWGNLGTFVEDCTLATTDIGERQTFRRWFIRQ